MSINLQSNSTSHVPGIYLDYNKRFGTGQSFLQSKLEVYFLVINLNKDRSKQNKTRGLRGLNNI